MGWHEKMDTKNMPREKQTIKHMVTTTDARNHADLDRSIRRKKTRRDSLTKLAQNT